MGINFTYTFWNETWCRLLHHVVPIMLRYDYPGNQLPAEFFQGFQSPVFKKIIGIIDCI